MDDVYDEHPRRLRSEVLGYSRGSYIGLSIFLSLNRVELDALNQRSILMRKQLQERFNALESLLAMFIISGNINSITYNEVDAKYEAVKKQLQKPMILVTTCRCGHVTERVVEVEPTDYIEVSESNRFFVYEAVSYDCSSCRKMAVGGNR